MNQIYQSHEVLGNFTKNLGELFIRNKELFGNKPAFAFNVDSIYQTKTWSELVDDIFSFSNFLLSKNLNATDKIAIVSANSYTRLVVEMATMCSGITAVPIFACYPKEMLEKLIEFSEVNFLIVDDVEKFLSLKTNVPADRIKRFSECEELIKSNTYAKTPNSDVKNISADTLAMIMFTSGTSKFPKGVMLTHKNILSQQKALDLKWKLPSGLRFLCYLPWHHSFGGLFERFLVINNGGCLYLDDSFGRDIDKLIANFKQARPHLYFSVPQVYQQIVSRVLIDKMVKEVFFHPELKFVFTAAAPLPLSVSDVFKRNNIPVVEGWGLTETSPCCTLTEQKLDRTPGIVGIPIPEVELKFAEEQEILVRGPNIMKGYYKLPEETKKVLDDDGWFYTGDVGEYTEEGLKIVSRKDRIFKLANAEKVFPVKIEESVRKKCNYIRFIYVLGSGEPSPYALVFPNFELLNANSSCVQIDDCAKPLNLPDFKGCFNNCLKDINLTAEIRFEQIKRAVVINRELSLERDELTPSMKLVPRAIEKNYAEYIECLKNGNESALPADAYMIDLSVDIKK